MKSDRILFIFFGQFNEVDGIKKYIHLIGEEESEIGGKDAVLHIAQNLIND